MLSYLQYLTLLYIGFSMPVFALGHSLPHDLQGELDRLGYKEQSVADAILYYDRYGNRLGLEAEIKAHCESLPKKVKKTGGRRTRVTINPECRKFLNANRAITKSPIFLNLIDRNRTGGVLGGRSHKNNSTERQILGEQQSAKKALSLNFEKFISDPEYRCRRPSLYQYFSKVFSSLPHDNYICFSRNKLPVIMKQEGRRRVSLKTLNLNSIYQIHYLMAGKGEKSMSRWGHSMLRIIRCAPYRKEVGPECLKDTNHHVVVAFVANVDDLTINSFKGVFGKYHSILKPNSYAQMVEKYQVIEGRTLHSYPINLNRNELELMVNRILELFWQYKGNYYFLGQNCASELMKILSVGRLNNIHLNSKVPSTPEGILKLLKRYSLVDKESMSPGSDADGSMDQGSNQGVVTDYESLEVDQRRSNYLESHVASPSALRQFLHFETLEVSYLEAKLIKSLSTHSSRKERKTYNNLASELSKNVTTIVKGEVVPGYGLPLSYEVTSLPAETLQQLVKQINVIEGTLFKAQKSVAPELIQELQKVITNIFLIKQNL